MKRTSAALRIVPLLAFALTMTSAGCTSIRSTLYSYDGCQEDSRVKKHLKGVPTTLLVPTHLQVTVKNTRWGKIDSATGRVTFVKDLENQDVEITPVNQKEIFTVDFKRPAAGELDYHLTFDKNQYITGIDNSLTDKTIADVTALVAAVIQSVPTTRSVVRDATTTAPSGLISITDVVAMDVFPLRDPDVQHRIQEFLATHVNNCHPSCKTVLRCPPQQ